MYIYGKNVATEAIKKNKKINKVFLFNKFNDQFIISELQKLKIETVYLEKFELDKLAKGNHQGIILNVPDFKYNTLDELLVNENPLIVILDHIEDPHNFGAIIRTCEAAKIDGIIIPKNRSVSVNETVVKVSAGAIENIKIAMVTNLSQTLTELKRKGFWIIGTDMEGTNYDKIDYKGKIAIITGNEGNGMARIVKEHCDFIATIPTPGKINSLNASVATGIVIFEAIKSRK
ncbi:MAG: 23S rRNA (guanosine(2251)-2'-O)-methyltransferase RlmB [Bacilli bacterium]